MNGSDSTSKFGFITYALGSYAEKNQPCMARLKRLMPDMPIQVHSDKVEIFKPIAATTVRENSVYDKVRRIRLMLESPFEFNVYTDCDAFVTEAVPELFELLRHKPLALVSRATRPHEHTADIPQTFTSFYSGVIAYRKTPGTMRILRQWEQELITLKQSNSGQQDEVPLRSVLYESSEDYFVLDSRYNFCFDQPHKIADLAGAKIVHSHKLGFGELHRTLTNFAQAIPDPEIAHLPNRAFRRDSPLGAV